MKKGILKAMAAGVFMTALASCTDDLDGGQSKLAGAKADLTATFDAAAINTRLGMQEVVGDNPWDKGKAAGWSWVFTKGDKVRVWSMESQIYEVYNITGGFDSPTATFEKDEQSQNLPEGKERWAVTDAQFAYSLSPNDQGVPVLTYTIPYQYTANSFTSESTANADVRRLPAPFWGQAVLADDGTLDVGLKALTAFLRIEMNTLPAGTQYIILTTHGDATTDGTNVTYDGFQLVEPDLDQEWVVGGTANKIKGGTASDFNLNSLASWENIEPITLGNSEPLTGTFNTTLVDKSSKLGKDAGLAGDDYGMAGIERLVTRDEMIVKVPVVDGELQEGGVFWIPIIAQHYNKLHVIAAVDKSKYAYKYVGKELKLYDDFTFDVAGRYRLTMNMTNLGKVCAHQLNEAIENINVANKYGLAAQNIINVDELIDCTESDDHKHTVGTQVYHGDAPWEYPTDQILVQGKGDLVINIAKISASAGEKLGVSPIRNDLGNGITADGKQKVLFVSDENYWTSTNKIRASWAGIGADNGEEAKSVTINIPADASDDNGQIDALLADLPKYDAIFATNNNFGPAQQTGEEKLEIFAHGSATKYVSGREVESLSEGDDETLVATLKNQKKAAITVVNSIKSLTVMDKTVGDVYVYDGNLSKVEINDALDVQTAEGINVRLDNALVRNAMFLYNSNKDNYLITTGSAAVANVEASDVADTEPNKLRLLSYWTGQALDDEQVNVSEYDKGTIYSVAQLASMGEKQTATYQINSLLEDMWLGGSIFGWVGPEVTVSGFTFDGNGVALKKMHMPQFEKDAVAAGGNELTVYTYDPHICCTSCGFNREKSVTPETGTAAVALTSYGLIRSINNTGADANTIKNVKLNDVYFYVTDKEGNQLVVTDNVGSLVGIIESEGKTSFDNIEVGEVQINLKNSNIGGLVGYQKKGDLEINLTRVGNDTDFRYNTGNVNGIKYVGGLVGKVGNEEDVENVTITDSKVVLGKDITASGDYAGGLIGDNTISGAAIISKTSVQAKAITANKFAAGFIGNIDAAQGAIADAAVTVENIEAADQYAGGLIGYSTVDETLDMITADITADKIKAENGFVGGELAYSNTGRVNVGLNMTESINPVTNIKIGELAGSYNVGGVVGANDNNSPVYVLAGCKTNKKNASKYFNEINVEVTEFSNTKGEGAALATYYKPSASEDMSHLAGTFSNIVGGADGYVYINENKLNVVDNLQSEMKIKVGYQQHPTQKHAGTPERYFWGDYNGYVGFGKSGRYYLNDATSADGANGIANAHYQVTGDQQGFNLYRELGDDYNDFQSKNAPAAAEGE